MRAVSCFELFLNTTKFTNQSLKTEDIRILLDHAELNKVPDNISKYNLAFDQLSA